jgi:hypothetical protein
MSSNPPYKNFSAPGKAPKLNEYQRTIKALTSHKSLNRRQLAMITGLEVPTLCRLLFNLVHKRFVLKIASISPCPMTGKRVYFYTLRHRKGLRDGK